MEKIRKNIKRIWNSRCKYLVMIACALIFMNGINLLQTSLKFLNKKGEMVEEVKSVVITSKTWESKGPGSWKVEKSADWTGYKKATIKFDVEITGLTGHSERDIILVLDTSGSMMGKKMVQLQSNVIELINFLLTEEGTKIALIGFNGRATLLSEFISDKDRLINIVNSLRGVGDTSYKNAYKSVIDLLDNYERNKERDLAMLFLTDGGAPAASAEYSILKGTYNIQIVGIQYELGTSIKQSIIDSSDVQYVASTINLKDVFFKSIGVESYEEFEITDYITEKFEVENISDIRVSRGSLELETGENGKQKVIWKIPTSEVKFITRFSATMEIDMMYKGKIDSDRLIATNEKEKVKVKVDLSEPGPDLEEIESEDTPRIRGGYYVTYDPNLPKECNTSGKDVTVTKAYFPYEKVSKTIGNYTCPGWQIKEWQMDGTEPDLGGDKFKMPSRDTKITAIWTKIDVNKKMEGTVYEVKKQALLDAMKENEGIVSVDISINFGSPSSESNGRGLYIRSGTQSDVNPVYYYRGAVENNNVLFAGMCWQIVRTTESGGIKLLYNGVSNDGKNCNSTGVKNIGTNIFNADKNVGYMYNYSIQAKCMGIASHNFPIGDTFWIGGTGIANISNFKATANPGVGYHYTCGRQNVRACQNDLLYYAYEYAGQNEKWCSINLGDRYQPTIEEYMEKAFENVNSSSVKIKMDNWYKTNIVDKGYSKYVDNNSVWCNDRTMTSGPLYSHNAGFGETLFAATGSRRLHTASANPAVKESVACSNARDRFTASSASTGNKVLMYPVGMLTADEVVLGGLTFTNSGSDSYLNNESSYWTMTPYKFGEEYDVFEQNYMVASNGQLSKYNVSSSLNILPSISLKPGTLVYGIGTKDAPYEVVIE